METILRTEKLCKYYGRGSSAVKAVDNVDISIGKGEFVSVIGKSGSGKAHCCICWADWTAPRQAVCFSAISIFTP